MITRRYHHFAYLALIFASLAWMKNAPAFHGYFLPAYGFKSMGVAGTGVAMPQDRMVGAISETGLALIEPGFDAELALLHPQREAPLECTNSGQCGEAVGDRSRRKLFAAPAFGFGRRWCERSTPAASLYGNGALNTTYGRALYDEVAARIAGQGPGDPGFPAHGKIGVDFAQCITALNFACRASERWTVGIAPLTVARKFSARGRAGVAPPSVDPGSLDGRNSACESGDGVRVGAVYLPSPDIHVGGQYTSRLFIHECTKYNGLFADGGNPDAPAHYSVGLSWDANARLTLAFDYQRILYGSTGTIENHGPATAELAGIAAVTGKT